MNAIETPIKKVSGKKLLEEAKAHAKAEKAKQPKAPVTIKLRTVWNVLVYTFAIIGVVLSVVFTMNAFNSYVDAQVEARTAQLKAQSNQ